MSPRVPNMLSVNAEHEITKLGVMMESVASSVRLMAEGFGATNEKLDRLASNVDVLTSSVADLLAELKTDVDVLKTDVGVLKISGRGRARG